MMKVYVYLTAGGAEKIVCGGGTYSWDFGSVLEAADIPQGGSLVGEVEAVIPSRDILQTKAIAALEAELQRQRAEAHMEERRIQERINNLLALPAPTATSEDDNDIPF